MSKKILTIILLFPLLSSCGNKKIVLLGSPKIIDDNFLFKNSFSSFSSSIDDSLLNLSFSIEDVYNLIEKNPKVNINQTSREVKEILLNSSYLFLNPSLKDITNYCSSLKEAEGRIDYLEYMYNLLFEAIDEIKIEKVVVYSYCLDSKLYKNIELLESSITKINEKINKLTTIYNFSFYNLTNLFTYVENDHLNNKGVLAYKEGLSYFL